MPILFSQNAPDHEYFAEDNVRFIQNRIGEMLLGEFRVKVLYDPESIVRAMMRVYERQLEDPVLMNRRVLIDLVREFRNHQYQMNRSLQWQEAFATTTGIYDPIANKGPDLQIVKLRNRLGRSKVGGTVSFAFI